MRTACFRCSPPSELPHASLRRRSRNVAAESQQRTVAFLRKRCVTTLGPWVRLAAAPRRAVRAADGAGLENQWAEMPRGFESHALRSSGAAGGAGDTAAGPTRPRCRRVQRVEHAGDRRDAGGCDQPTCVELVPRSPSVRPAAGTMSDGGPYTREIRCSTAAGRASRRARLSSGSVSCSSTGSGSLDDQRRRRPAGRSRDGAVLVRSRASKRISILRSYPGRVSGTLLTLPSACSRPRELSRYPLAARKEPV
ncbi:MAG: hypothetical protein JWP66_430 [Naasia sp.]|nr:hypothetical protein [Naasia sp.]